MTNPRSGLSKPIPSATVATSAFISPSTRAILEGLALLGREVRVVGAGVDPLAGEVRGHALGVGDREAVDDPAAGHRRDVLREPGEALRLVAEVDRVEVERVAPERAADDAHVLAELAHRRPRRPGRWRWRSWPGPGRAGRAVEGCGRCGGSRGGSRGPSRRCSAPRPPRTGRWSPRMLGQDVVGEALVGEPLRGDRAGRRSRPRARPCWTASHSSTLPELIVAARIAEPLRHRDLVAHQRRAAG